MTAPHATARIHPSSTIRKNTSAHTHHSKDHRKRAMDLSTSKLLRLWCRGAQIMIAAHLVCYDGIYCHMLGRHNCRGAPCYAELIGTNIVTYYTQGQTSESSVSHRFREGLPFIRHYAASHSEHTLELLSAFSKVSSTCWLQIPCSQRLRMRSATAEQSS